MPSAFPTSDHRPGTAWLGGNQYRLIARILCRFKTVIVQDVLTHKQYEGEMERMTTAIDPAYDALLREIQPAAIHNKREHNRLLQQVLRLTMKGEDNLTGPESAIVEMLLVLIHEYERTALPPRQKQPPARMLAYLMEQTGTKASDLPLEKSRVSEILSGTRGISKAQAFDLGKFFKISPILFLEP
jgi:antitoxin component HigA of HigAB toxin-antitoxin module